MMLLIFCLTGTVKAQNEPSNSWGFRLEHQPRVEETAEIDTSWIPWLEYGTQRWNFKSTVLTNIESQQSNTSETKEQTIFSRTLIGLEAERTIQSDNLHWNLGFGLQRHIPFISQSSTQYTELEQETVDTQTENQEAELSFTRIRIPISIQVPVNNRLNFGLGAQTSYTIQRSQSDFTTYFNTSWNTSPIIYIQIR